MQKIAQNVSISLGYFIFSNDHTELQRITQSAKRRSIWSRCIGQMILDQKSLNQHWQAKHLTLQLLHPRVGSLPHSQNIRLD
jgi:hypothetical protein